MRISAVSHLNAELHDDNRLEIIQRASGLTAVIQAVFLLPVLIAVMIPGAMIAAETFADPAMRNRLAASPVNTAVALSGIAIWLTMFGVPVFRALRRLGWSRSIVIERQIATSRDFTVFGAKSQELPLTAFEGLSHNVRTKLSGTRHELILVHRNPSKSLLLDLAENISHEEAAKFANNIGVKLLPERWLLRQQPKLHGIRTLNLPELMRPKTA